MRYVYGFVAAIFMAGVAVPAFACDHANAGTSQSKASPVKKKAKNKEECDKDKKAEEKKDESAPPPTPAPNPAPENGAAPQ